jgi:DNA-binding MarR family transcriptional regulator
VSINRTGHWLLVRVSEQAPVRLSDIAESVDLDLSTISRQVRDLVAAGLLRKVPDPADGRAALLSLTDEGAAVLEAVSESRRQVLAEAISGWTSEERNALASGLLRLGAGLHHSRATDEAGR